MALVWVVRTGTYLPRAKKHFDCRCEALKWVKSLLLRSSPLLDKNDILSCVQMICVDEDKLGPIERYFPQSAPRSPWVRKEEKYVDENVD